MLGSKRPSEVMAGDIDQLASAVLDRGSPAMARRLITHVKALYNYSLLDAPRLAEKFRLQLNPCAPRAPPPWWSSPLCPLDAPEPQLAWTRSPFCNRREQCGVPMAHEQHPRRAPSLHCANWFAL
jgi:hypothetical protein